MTAAYLDTNILIGFFKGDQTVKAALVRFQPLKIPSAAYTEFLVGLKFAAQIEAADRVISALFEIVQTDIDICHEAADLRRKMRLKLPDALIYATARIGGGVLITRDTKDFDPHAADIYVPIA
jgi:predicted nucleic acid-binding protein